MDSSQVCCSESLIYTAGKNSKSLMTQAIVFEHRKDKKFHMVDDISTHSG